MARRRNGRPLNGWIILDKPRGIASTQAVNQVRRLLGAAKAGHGGTLDPLATGVLPIALGEATKTVPFVVDGLKGYEFTIQWGAQTDTDDSEGRVVKNSDLRPEWSEIEALLPGFRGDIVQLPPDYSALKVNGERAYKRAREGLETGVVARHVTVHQFDQLSTDEGGARQSSKFFVRCGKGTYIRALARDLGHALGCYGHITELRRIFVGSLTVEQAISLEYLEQVVHSAPPEQILLPIEIVLADIPALAVTGGEARRLRAGQPVHVPSSKSGTVYVTADRQLVAVADLEQGRLKPLRVFNL